MALYDDLGNLIFGDEDWCDASPTRDEVECNDHEETPKQTYCASEAEESDGVKECDSGEDEQQKPTKIPAWEKLAALACSDDKGIKRLARKRLKEKRMMMKKAHKNKDPADNSSDSADDIDFSEVVKDAVGNEDVTNSAFPFEIRRKHKKRKKPQERTADERSSDTGDDSSDSSKLKRRRRAPSRYQPSLSPSHSSGESESDLDTEKEEENIFKELEPKIVQALRDGMTKFLPKKKAEQETLVSNLVSEVISFYTNKKKRSSDPNTTRQKNTNEFVEKLYGKNMPQPTALVDSWNRCVAPDMSELYAQLGRPSLSQENCWACRKDPSNTVASNIEEWDNLTAMYRNSVSRMNKVQLAKQLYFYFEEKIRQPANANLEPGQQPIPKWKAIDIFIHMMRHTNEPVSRMNNAIANINTMLEKQYDNGVYECNRGHAEITKPNKDGAELYLKLLDFSMRVYKCHPEKMFMARNVSEFTNSTASNFINPAKRGFGGKLARPTMLKPSM